MNTRKIFYGILTCLILMVSACTSETSEDDALYEVGIKRNKIIRKSQASDDNKTKVKIQSIKRNKIIRKN